MSLIRWEPFEELTSLRKAMDRLEESFFGPRRRWVAPLVEARLPVDMYETDDEVVVEASLPGIKPEDVDVTITGDTLRIKGEAKYEKEIKPKTIKVKTK